MRHRRRLAGSETSAVVRDLPEADGEEINRLMMMSRVPGGVGRAISDDGPYPIRQPHIAI